MYQVEIHLIAMDVVITKGSFETEEEAWAWVEENNLPFADFFVVPKPESPPKE